MSFLHPENIQPYMTTRLFFFVLLLCALQSTFTQPAQAQDVEFGRDVLPILSDACFHCHGTDPGTREADLRLDTEEGLFGVVERDGNPESSYLFERITDQDPDSQMPPADNHRQLTAQEKSVLREWLEQGAPWSGHWAFEPIKSPEVPAIDDLAIRHPIDAFVRETLATRGLAPSPQADWNTLLRRVSLDLTGLPPNAEAAAAFLNAPPEKEDEAYDSLVDHLLDSPAYGERMASVWMEVARYADSDGYQLDQIRSQYPWRDWVIRAFNDNMSYDQFITEQLAGDLLENATDSQIIATGFNRNHILNGEGGVDPNETRIEVVADRSEIDRPPCSLA